nr:hypothetical protein BaRGS_025810 [Batillaria attramentaria]
MRACWRHSPNERPTFNTLRHWLEDMMADCSGVEYLDVNLNPNKDYYHCHSSDSELDSSDLDDSTVQGSDNVFREDDGSCGGSRNCASPDSGMSAGDSGEGSPNSSPQHTVVTSAGLNLGSGKLNALVTSSPSAKGKLSALAVTSSSSDKGKVNTLGTSSTSAAGKPHTFALTSSSSDEGKLHTLVASSAGDPVNLLDSPDVIVHRALSATDSCSTVTSVSSASSGTSRSKVIRPGNAELDKRGQNDEMTSVDDVDDKGNEADQEDDDDDDDVDDGDRDDIDDAKTDRDQQEDVDEEWGFSLSTSPMTVPDPMTCWDDVFEECEDRDLVPGTLLHRKPFPGLASRGQPFMRLVCDASACSSETAAGQISNTNRLTRWGSQGESVGTSSSSGESVMSAQHDDLSLRQFTLTSPHVHESVCRNTASQPTFRRFQVNPRSDPSSQRQQQKGQPDLVVSERPATSVLLHPGAGSARMAVFYTKNGTKDPGVATSRLQILEQDEEPIGLKFCFPSVPRPPTGSEKSSTVCREEFLTAPSLSWGVVPAPPVVVLVVVIVEKLRGDNQARKPPASTVQYNSKLSDAKTVTVSTDGGGRLQAGNVSLK